MHQLDSRPRPGSGAFPFCGMACPARSCHGGHFANFRIVMMLRQRAVRLAFAGSCLAAVPAWLLAAEAGASPSLEGHAFDALATSEGGALYSPFSTATQTSAPSIPPAGQSASAPAQARGTEDGSPDLVTTSVTVLLAAGGLALLVRVLVAS